MWKYYFIFSQITGFDIDPNCKKYNSLRINIFIGDQSKSIDKISKRYSKISHFKILSKILITNDIID